MLRIHLQGVPLHAGLLITPQAEIRSLGASVTEQQLHLLHTETRQAGPRPNTALTRQKYLREGIKAHFTSVSQVHLISHTIQPYLQARHESCCCQNTSTDWQC